jgi:porin
VLPGRPEDSFGFGLARTQFSSSFVPFLRQQFNLGLQREDAIEMYYNAAIAPWMDVTTDLQIIHSGLNKAVSPTTGQLAGIDSVVLLGTRLRMRFSRWPAQSSRRQRDRRAASAIVAPPAQSMAYK